MGTFGTSLAHTHARRPKLSPCKAFLHSVDKLPTKTIIKQYKGNMTDKTELEQSFNPRRGRELKKKYSASQARRRYIAAHKFNYIIADDCSDEGGHRYSLYYDENTQRNERFEYNSRRAGFEIKRWNEKL